MYIRWLICNLSNACHFPQRNPIFQVVVHCSTLFVYNMRGLGQEKSESVERVGECMTPRRCDIAILRPEISIKCLYTTTIVYNCCRRNITLRNTFNLWVWTWNSYLLLSTALSPCLSQRCRFRHRYNRLGSRDYPGVVSSLCSPLQLYLLYLKYSTFVLTCSTDANTVFKNRQQSQSQIIREKRATRGRSNQDVDYNHKKEMRCSRSHRLCRPTIHSTSCRPPTPSSTQSRRLVSFRRKEIQGCREMEAGHADVQGAQRTDCSRLHGRQVCGLRSCVFRIG
jgi:hypothetical protein